MIDKTRFRNINGTYQYLVTPIQIYNASFEFMLSNWTDVNFDGFKIVTDINQILDCDGKYPRIDWDALNNTCIESYVRLNNLILTIIRMNRTICGYSSHLMKPTEIKNSFFDRVSHFGDQFRLAKHMNDIMQFSIYINKQMDDNNGGHMFDDIVNVLTQEENLNLAKKQVLKNETLLIGETDVNITYTIFIKQV